MRHQLQSANDSLIADWVSNDYFDKKTRKILGQVTAMSQKITVAGVSIQGKNKKLDEIFKNQERIRKNLNSLGNLGDEKGLRDRYVNELKKRRIIFNRLMLR